MDWRDEYDSAIAERNRLIMALTAAEKRAEAAEADLQDALSAVDLYQKRAFSAEDRVAELEAELLMDYDELSAVNEAARARAEAAEHRVAELEARLAEQEWRPVTERRYNDGNERPEYYADVELLIVGFMNDSGQWVYNEDLPGFRSPVRGWRPLPPPPQDS